jgi:hypothetical protein
MSKVKAGAEFRAILLNQAGVRIGDIARYEAEGFYEDESDEGKVRSLVFAIEGIIQQIAKEFPSNFLKNEFLVGLEHAVRNTRSVVGVREEGGHV